MSARDEHFINVGCFVLEMAKKRNDFDNCQALVQVLVLVLTCD